MVNQDKGKGMKKRKQDWSHAEELRLKAEERMKLENPLPEEISPAEAQKLIHELRVHQIELEMQNDELRQAQEILEESRSRYSDLYDFAPIGYLTLDELGIIREANLTAARLLQVERSRLIDRQLTHFMVTEDRGAFRRHLNLVLKGRERQTVELRLKIRDGQTFFTLLESAFYQDAAGRSLVRTAFSDIRKRKWAEKALQASYRFLEIANRHKRMAPLLQASVAEVKNLTGYKAVGIRILQENGEIPYESYDGFSQEFYDLENRLSIWVDRCMCINIMKGDTDSQFPYYTPGGSFYINRLDEFFCKLSTEERRTLRGNCRKFGYESMALVPIRLRGQILGMVHAADPRKDIMPLAMVHLLEKVGMLLGTAIQRVRAEEALYRAHDDMERLVEERTAELRFTVESLQEEITERLRAEEALKESEQRLRYLTSQLLTAQERERKRISRELHDDLGQSLLVLKMQMRDVERNLLPELKDAREGCSAALNYLDGIIDNIRRISQDLMPTILEDMGLSTALIRLFDEFCKGQKIECSFDMDDIANSLSRETEIIIYRIFQETLTNIGKHAQATKIETAIKKCGKSIHFSVKDNGTGFNVEHVLGGTATARGMGLGSMEERVRMLDGTLKLWSEEGKGTKISFLLPININKPNEAEEQL